MKKILTLGLMFVVFAPFSVFASCPGYIDPNTGGFVSTGPCTTDTTTASPSGSSASVNSGLSSGAGNLSLLFSLLGAILNAATKLILAAAVVFFLWGVFQFVKGAGNEEAQKVGKVHIIYGIIGIAVMVAMWGLVNFLTSTANLDVTSTGLSAPALLTQ